LLSSRAMMLQATPTLVNLHIKITFLSIKPTGNLWFSFVIVPFLSSYSVCKNGLEILKTKE
jgi:hypothetical protein